MKIQNRWVGSSLYLCVALTLLVGASSAVRAADVWISGKDIPTAPGEVTIGNSSAVVRTVTGKIEAGKRYLNYRDDIYRNEIVETYEESATELTFLDDTTLSLGPETTVVLDRFVYDPDASGGEFVLSVTKGALRFATGKLNKDAYEIHTPVSTIGIRGTVIDVIVGKSREGVLTRVSVLEGEATLFACGGHSLRLPAGSSGEVVDLSGDCFSGKLGASYRPEYQGIRQQEGIQ